MFGQHDRDCTRNRNFAPETKIFAPKIAPETRILHWKPRFASEIKFLHRKRPLLVQILRGLYQICHMIVTKLYQIAPEISRTLRASLWPRHTALPLMAASPEDIGLLFPAPKSRSSAATRGFRGRTAPQRYRTRRAPCRTEWTGTDAPLKTREKPINKNSPP